MDFADAPEHAEFRREFRAWLDANLADDLKVEDAQDQRISPDREILKKRIAWQKKMHAAGWVGISWPKEYGGRGANFMQQVIWDEEYFRARAPILPCQSGLNLLGPTLIHWGTEEQKKRHLPKILSADEIWCQGFSEPGAGSDLASLKTRAVRDGQEWVVTGQKVWTTFAHHAKWCMLVARTDPEAAKHKGLTYFLMDMEQDAVQVRPLRQITGESEFNELFIEEARIPDENIVGGEGNGWAVAITTLMHERATLAFGLQVGVKLALGELMELAKRTRVNGASAAEDPLFRDRLAQLYVESEVLRLNAYRGLTATMKYGVPGPEGSLGKWHWSEVNQALTELAMDIEGERAQLEQEPWTYRFLRA